LNNHFNEKKRDEDKFELKRGCQEHLSIPQSHPKFFFVFISLTLQEEEDDDNSGYEIMT